MKVCQQGIFKKNVGTSKLSKAREHFRVRLNGEEVEEVKVFEYLGSTIAMGELEVEDS